MNEKLLIALATIGIHIVALVVIVAIDDATTPEIKMTSHEELVGPDSTEERDGDQISNKLKRSLVSTSMADDTDLQTYIVQAGDNLTKIAKRVYGSSKHYRDIFEANKDRLKTPQSIRAGQQLVIPALQ